MLQSEMSGYTLERCRITAGINPHRICQVNMIFNKHLDKITPHTLRHFFCTIALEKGEYCYHEVANLAGHSSIHTTMLNTNPTAQKIKQISYKSGISEYKYIHNIE